MTAKPVLTDEQEAEIITLRAANHHRWTIVNLAEHFNVGRTTIRRILDPEGDRFERERSKALEVMRKGKRHSHSGRYREKIDYDALKLAQKIPEDVRDLTARILGDPLPNRSALARHVKRQMQLSASSGESVNSGPSS